MSPETNTQETPNEQPAQPPLEQTTPPDIVSETTGSLQQDVTEVAQPPTEPATQHTGGETVRSDLFSDEDTVREEAPQQGFFRRRLAQIYNGYNNLSRKQKDVLYFGALAASTMIMPAIGVMDGGSHAQTSAEILQAEGLMAFAGLNVAAYKRFFDLMRNR